MGAEDAAYNRNKVAKEWEEKLSKLQIEDPEGYAHEVMIHEGKGHWMDRQDTVAVPWMAKFTRNPIPKRVVWNKDHVSHTRFYWLGIPAKKSRSRHLVKASYSGQRIQIETHEGLDSLYIFLNDQMLDLDKKVVISKQDTVLFEGIVGRKLEHIEKSIRDRSDPGFIFPARIAVGLK